MKKIFLLLITALTAFAPELAAKEPTRAEKIVAELHKPQSETVLVAAHRGDWRNWPENSLPAMESAINMGVDIIELDLALTKDSVLVVCHDRRLDRTTTGKGLVSDVPYDSIQTMWLRAGHGVKTEVKMPTLREALLVCKDRVVVNIDKGYEYYDLALALCEELGVTDQILIKGTAMPDVVASKFAEHPHNMLYMPIINLSKKNGLPLYDAYKSSCEVPMAYELCWSTRTPDVDAIMAEMLKSGAKLWVNSLWPSLNGGLCDDAAAVNGVEDIYGKMIADGATIIQTDRPTLLLNYLRRTGHHE